MNINPLVESALADIGCPVSVIKHDGDEAVYITYYTVAEVSELYADGEEIATGTYATVDIFSKDNYKPLLKEARQSLKQAGFTVRGTGPEMWEPDTQYYHVPIEIYIEEGLEV